MSITLLLGLMIGLILGLTGAGGGIFSVPALVQGMGLSMSAAAPVALVAVAGSAALGAVEAGYNNLVQYRSGLVIALVGAPMTMLGRWLAQQTSEAILTLLFATVMLLVALRLLKSLQRTNPKNQTTPIKSNYLTIFDHDNNCFIWHWQTWVIFLLIGAISGFMTGLLAVGGGFIIVPLLRQFTPLTMRSCIATSLMIIAIISSGGIISALSQGATLPLPITIWFSLSTAIGLLIGRKVSNYLPDNIIQMCFASLLIIVASGMAISVI